MAHVIDLRRNGGEMVLIGKALTLPASNDAPTPGSEPLLGSIRFNPDTSLIEVWLPRGATGIWYTIGVTEQHGSVVYVDGATMSGDLRQNGGRFLVDNGSLGAPGLGFSNRESTGLLLSDAGLMQIAVDGALAVEFGATLIDLKKAVATPKLTTPILNATTATFTATTTGTLVSSASVLGTAQATSVTVLPPAGGSNLIAEIALTTQGRDWTVTHEADHSLTLRADTSRIFTFRTNGTLEAAFFSGQAASVRNGDLAERYHADAVYEPGTVLVIGGANEVTTTTILGNPRVAGVVSSNPGLRLNEAAGSDASHPFVALKGRVPCKIVGPVWKGDTLVTSSTPGHAQTALGHSPQAVIGKALQDFPDHGPGVIEIKV